MKRMFKAVAFPTCAFLALITAAAATPQPSTAQSEICNNTYCTYYTCQSLLFWNCDGFFCESDEFCGH